MSRAAVFPYAACAGCPAGASALNQPPRAAQAREADARRARGERGPLLGMPIAHKDIFVTRGWASTAGSRQARCRRSNWRACTWPASNSTAT
jgi:Asp-tRNA(Asn)/Glu-tRNA(Gln) amidotransferase A subunit family amidase